MQSVNAGEPWYGRPVYELLGDIDPTLAYKKPGHAAHSLAELLYHMITWADFTLKRIQGDKEKDMAAFEKLDWREIDPSVHSWEKGVEDFRKIHSDIISLLETKEDGFLDEKVDYRNYNFRVLINGLIQHNIYHIGQVAYVKNLFA